MTRPFSGKVHTGLTRQKQKNGDIYILERTTKYDPEVGYTRNLSYKLIGKIKAGTTEMVPPVHVVLRLRKKIPGQLPTVNTLARQTFWNGLAI